MRRLLTAIALSFFAFAASAQFQGLIVNEFSQGDQGSREYIELLVAGTRTCTDSTADLRGWIFDDQNGWYGTGSITAGHYRFKNVSDWSAVPFGSVIVVYNSASSEKNLSITAADDPADANHDYTYILPINSSAYIEENDVEPLTVSGPSYIYPLASSVTGYANSSNTWLSHIALNNGGDVISTVSPSDRTTAYFSIGYNFPAVPGFQSPTVSVGNVNGGMNCYLSTSNYSTPGSWIVGNADPLLGAVTETPGSPNGGANTTWINAMRQQQAPLAPGVNPSQPNCNNNTGSISITSPFGPGYSYSKDGINYNPFNTIFTGLSQGVYPITVMYNGCVSPPSIVTINAAPATPSTPAVTIIQPDCNSVTGTVTINTPAGSGLTYSISGTYQSSNIFTGVIPGTYGVTAKNSSGCTSSATIITIDPPPLPLAAPVVNITSQPTCATPTGSINVTSPAGMSYSVDGFDYSNTTGFFNNLAAGNYNVTAKNSSGCTSPATAIVINAPPQAPSTPVLTIGQTSCTSAAGSIIITSPTGTGLSYSIDGINYSAQTVYNSLLPGNYSASVRDANGCTSAAIAVSIHPQPSSPAAPAINVVQPTCNVATGTININSPVGMNYSIDGIDFTNTNGVFSNLLPGSYSVTAQNASGCISPAANVTIDPQPSTPVVSVNSPTICPGNNATVAATASAGNYNYVWTVPNGETNPGNVPGFIASTGGTYSVTVTNTAGCSATASGVLSVVPVAVVTADDKIVCQNGTVQLTAQPAGGTWSAANVSGNAFNASGLNAGNYTATYTYNSGGCSGSAVATITVIPLPPVPGIVVSDNCGSSTLTASNIAGTVLWSNNATTASINVNTPGSYSVTQTVNGCTGASATAIATPVITQFQNQNISGCGTALYNGNSYTTSTTVNDTLRSVNGCDSIIQIINVVVRQPSVSSLTVCKPVGQSYDFNGNILNLSGHYTDTIVGFNGCDSIIHLDLLIAVTQTNTVNGCEAVLFNGITYSASTTIDQVIPSITTGCDSIIRITNIIVHPKPSITTSEDKIICKGDSVKLTAFAIDATIHWLGVASGNSIVISPYSNTTYKAVAISPAGCNDTGSVNVSINPFEIQLTASATQVISGSTVQLQTSSSSSYEVLSWTPQLLFPGQKAAMQSIAVDSSVNVIVIAQSPQGCRDSASITVIANPLDDIYIPTAFTPNGDGKNDLFRVMGGNVQSFEMKIFNRWGELVFMSNERARGWDGSFRGKLQPEAVYVYLVNVTLTNGKKVSRKGTVSLIR